MFLDIRVQAEPFDPPEEQRTLWLGQTQIGALVSFIGLMRDFNEGHPVSRLTLEHYPGMTEKALGILAEEAASRWPSMPSAFCTASGFWSPRIPSFSSPLPPAIGDRPFVPANS